ncbi:bifunctional N-acetylglucosamine-1-phosphate uridyltransferase/glucosamine-1-phosphate acetyltransferase [Thalassovita autumnalis]|uniref:Bifunctional N-acetylglucosamine-1-phosphate uridyltransferase/glucosamine-1-phosphate acetyltransferase n=1 Tax=Thalassovita autumnalis TaxID=2072972 RepID=A0A0P1FDH5_9RHOB|nr:nucleotidyltransferase family protein [Thalassovita autumnalis]CUH66270.1 bifunctional N-acetylglucosamine-1-phosphate uridyltransferase/glucosamine-1-phosphate acetyltransferase [Thalassovita autumnalis]CUH72574.1 bifunctional N-acetylglucosamine-1-phosphate uridyltransferase/glucosamine-1-phosphate acetyltransferase [Thalassovita autumnalis]
MPRSVNPDTVMLFAAGFGTRMGALTAERPKPLVLVAGRALIDHALDLTAAVGISKTVVNLHYRGQMIRDHLAGRQILFAEEPEILETGGGLKAALPLLGPDPVLTLNSDAIWQGPNPIEALLAAWDPTRMDALMMLIPPKQALGYAGLGDFHMAEGGQLTRGPGAIYGGVQILKTEGLYEINQNAFSLNLLWDQMLSKGRLFGLTYPGAWCDVGNPDGLKLAEDLIGTKDV